MGVMQYLSENHAALLYMVAVLSFIIELTVLGLSGPLLFFALSCFVTAVLTSSGVLVSLESEILSVGVLMAMFTMVLWRPLKNFQNSGGGADDSSDMIGQHVPCMTQVSAFEGKIRHSGVQWNARLAPSCSVSVIEEGATCVIAGVEGNVMLVTTTVDS